MRTLGLVLLLTISGLLPTRAADSDAFAQNRKLGRGVNVLGYDPIWRAPEQGRFKDKHFSLLANAGFNSLRFNLHPFRHMGAAPEFKLPPSWFRTVDWVLTNAQANGLNVIMDCHEYNSMGQDPEANHDKFLSFWRQVSQRYAHAPSSVCFELLNEPSRKLTPELWNQYLKEALGIVRERNPHRIVIIGPASYNSIDHLKELELPESDRDIIVTVHYYKPMEFTHQGAAWSNHKDKHDIEWLGTDKDLKAINDDFARAAEWAKAHERPLFLGEFGAYDKGPMPSRVRYTAAVARAAEKRGWSWAYWQFDSDFIVFDIGKDKWVEPIRDALVPRRS